jgi:ATP-dependent phosphoenolpyruvate carboxykinase
MHTRRFPRGLVLLNAGLLLLLGAVTLAPASHAQRGGARARGDYAMVAGKITGSSAHAVFIVDSANQEMVAVRWSESSKSLDPIGYRDLKEDGQLSPGR